MTKKAFLLIIAAFMINKTLAFLTNDNANFQESSKFKLPLTKVTPLNKKASAQREQQKQKMNNSYKDLQSNTNIAPLVNLGDSLYYITLELGSNKQKLNFQIDTGSSLLWVDTTLCEKGKCNHCEKYDFKSSTTSYYSNQNINYTYVSGQLQCYLGSDFVGISQQNQQVNTTLCYAYQEQVFSNMNQEISGIIGLNNGDSYTNLIDSLYQAGEISSNRYALSLQHFYTNKDSYLYIADAIPESISSQTTWINVSQKNRWTLKCIGVYLNDTEDITSTISSYQDVLFDSGTTLTYLTKDLYNRIVKDLENICTIIDDTRIACPCFSPQLPTYTFYFQGVKFNFTSKHYLINQEYNFAFCQLGIYYIDSFKQMIFGDTVLVTIPISFDKQENQIGLASLPQIENIKSNGYSITIICLASLSAIVLLALIVFQLKVKKAMKNADQITDPLLSNTSSANNSNKNNQNKPGLPTNRSDVDKSVYE
ncbi:eukaryotic aspartyl protease (macronuclear) [Tetrahymena thermophila SB210]|uniref:Eukaryotic aspartyl protease n=1 Tax=Tetrahymena thermophila (strain SB210) TaxID=312017 RepID=I7M1J3_TETTS|nr:eukaryotic aspartyl protease [Tetrahymena thermophila SB210]EAR96453.2 eukaryotic aspartyl protease [Tetrahymena thermophila SB210]|eukprot:XP_001016698.2 eukaryotic aspartyl protease [Tetrahymena thermophila SB210]